VNRMHIIYMSQKVGWIDNKGVDSIWNFEISQTMHLYFLISTSALLGILQLLKHEVHD
jgi:hypothetical protein